MMISPEEYMELKKNLNLEELIKERNKLIRGLHKFEKSMNENKDIDDCNRICMDPSPEVVYQCYNDYLIKLTELINKNFIEIYDK